MQRECLKTGWNLEGANYFKGSDPHKATVLGEILGDPFKCTSGPYLYIFNKLMAVISLVIALLIK